MDSNDLLLSLLLACSASILAFFFFTMTNLARPESTNSARWWYLCGFVASGVGAGILIVVGLKCRFNYLKGLPPDMLGWMAGIVLLMGFGLELLTRDRIVGLTAAAAAALLTAVAAAIEWFARSDGGAGVPTVEPSHDATELRLARFEQVASYAVLGMSWLLSIVGLALTFIRRTPARRFESIVIACFFSSLIGAILLQTSLLVSKAAWKEIFGDRFFSYDPNEIWNQRVAWLAFAWTAVLFFTWLAAADPDKATGFSRFCPGVASLTFVAGTEALWLFIPSGFSHGSRWLIIVCICHLLLLVTAIAMHFLSRTATKQ